MNKRLIAPVILCLLGVAILSNRILTLRQFTLRLNQDTSFHLPLNNTTPSHAEQRAVLIALPNEGVSDVPELQRHVTEVKTDPASLLGDSLAYLKLQTGLAFRPSVYLLQSVLNL